MRPLLVLLAVVAGACLPTTTGATTTRPSAPADSPPPPSGGISAQVTFVSDGDSFNVDLNGEETRVRMIGINTPERDECFGAEAREMLIDLIDDRQLLLVSDRESFDQYGRMLAYVYLDDLLINAEMARLGAALARPYEPNTTLQSFLDAAESDAQDSGRGMWSPETCGGDADPTVIVVEVNADAPGRDHENLNGEFVVVRNSDEVPIDLGGWTVRDESSVHRYVFGAGTTLAAGETMTVFTGCGDDDPHHVYWCEDSPVWDNSGDTAFLVEPDGSTHHRFNY